jgi:hypothetical protein
MPRKQAAPVPQIVAGNDNGALICIEEGLPATISWSLEQYFRFEVATSESSQKVQRRACRPARSQSLIFSLGYCLPRAWAMTWPMASLFSAKVLFIRDCHWMSEVRLKPQRSQHIS